MVGRKPNSNNARKGESTQKFGGPQPDGEYHMHVHYDDDGVFYEDEVDHAAVAEAASKKPARVGKRSTLVILAFVGMGSLIAVNAAFLQETKHPSPMIVTRASHTQLDSSALVKATQRLQRQELVAEVQRELRRLGIYPGSLDGQFGPATERAVRAYQRKKAMVETGLVTEALLALLTMDFSAAPASPSSNTDRDSGNEIPIPRASPEEIAALTQGGSHLVQPIEQTNELTERIKRMQQTLASLGYGPLTIDGIPGDETALAIRAFQRDNALPVDGKMSEALISKLAGVSGTRI
ncbi:putative peptidoglycan binding domain protein [Pseudovibrio axinellae]|uniref:Putative peptidoglycan binding domain protein n=1 Tax=Pseudovibrio axinellae TaxID=989403 RepID=A0A166AED6_9HYPH|nr:peptidoglycan-binding protein [Pseudovibrio axinellae]KZL20962.1 putative peptidoglycan binding domain protein [Pseudovibrio axinellae]SEP81157.1 Peptidoglycan-binding (PGRP) domain of peptidoglycan hydrolases-containing protein [Pseudovibrio axinellae]